MEDDVPNTWLWGSSPDEVEEAMQLWTELAAAALGASPATSTGLFSSQWFDQMVERLDRVARERLLPAGSASVYPYTGREAFDLNYLATEPIGGGKAMEIVAFSARASVIAPMPKRLSTLQELERALVDEASLDDELVVPTFGFVGVEAYATSTPRRSRDERAFVSIDLEVEGALSYPVLS